mmetsp:Transcript_15847/g.31022  ORF Transcript_15847/g.31022 Transcript_15847/m.31022 type:complete len:643 (+) Transcript_15847:57-1985(+)|eukprot:CAMPEP_0175151108 /NCGR_PEP_ID=MMETSP0087-20121206/18292_1 /TAXON_ID=136419 /ORGANISM="Unknown Unknown, Strain D1" /LENGTH=642 /DNA_ID=CAMNT_0016437227 /DNA_START=57 /DNA_END=1985 /DNA_ORIENTATION=-
MGCSKSKHFNEKLEFLSGTVLGLYTTIEELREFVKIFKLRRYETGFRIIHQSEENPETFYVIAQGSMSITCASENKDDAEQFLCTKQQGSFVGERALFDPKHQRSANVTCAEDCTCLVTTRPKFQKFIENLTAEQHQRFRKILGTSTREVLLGVPMLENLDMWKIQLLESLFRTTIHQPGAFILQEGSFGQTLYIIYDGNVKCTRDCNGTELTLGQKTKGDFFGEISLLADVPRTANIVAMDKVLTLSLEVEDFRRFLQIAPELLGAFRAAMKNNIVNYLHTFNVPFLKSLTDRINELAEACELLTIGEDCTVYNEGDEGDGFFVIVHGQISLTKDGSSVKMGTGKWFGEESLVCDSLRDSTVEAVTRSVLLKLHKHNFRSFFTEDDEVLAETKIRMLKANVDLRTVLTHSAGRNQFSLYLADEYSTENLAFVDAVGAFVEQCRVADGAKVKEAATELYAKYVDAKAKEQVNIPARLREEIKETMQKEQFCATMFNAAKEEILRLMSVDTFKRFSVSHRFQSLLDQIGDFDDEVEEQDHLTLQKTRRFGSRKKTKDSVIESVKSSRSQLVTSSRHKNSDSGKDESRFTLLRKPSIDVQIQQTVQLNSPRAGTNVDEDNVVLQIGEALHNGSRFDDRSSIRIA